MTREGLWLGPAAMSESSRGPMLLKCLVWRELLRRGHDPGAAGASRCRRPPNRSPERGSPRGSWAGSGGMRPLVGAVTGS